jgi:hypothetical protein
MTILSTIQRASSEMGITRPGSVFSATDRTSVELQDVANEMAEQIGNAHEWQRLKTLQTYTGNGVTDKYPLPTDYGRMGKDQQVWSSRLSAAALQHILSTDDWLMIEANAFTTVTGAWHMYGGYLDFHPVLISGERASFYYLTEQIIEDELGTGQTVFLADTDVFRLPERLLRLGIILHWRRKKGLPFDEGPYFTAMTEEIRRDGGAKTLTVGGRTRLVGDTPLYPFTIA